MKSTAQTLFYHLQRSCCVVTFIARKFLSANSCPTRWCLARLHHLSRHPISLALSVPLSQPRRGEGRSNLLRQTIQKEMAGGGGVAPEWHEGGGGGGLGVRVAGWGGGSQFFTQNNTKRNGKGGGACPRRRGVPRHRVLSLSLSLALSRSRCLPL